MPSIRSSKLNDGARVFRIWCDAVDATHRFLSLEDRAAIGQEVEAYLPAAPLILAVDGQDHALGFMALSGSHIDALFIDPTHHGSGVGRHLVEHAIGMHSTLTTSVNEQNTQAMGFYERLGFVRTGRSQCDDQGRPYPLIHLRLQRTA